MPRPCGHGAKAALTPNTKSIPLNHPPRAGAGFSQPRADSMLASAHGKRDLKPATGSLWELCQPKIPRNFAHESVPLKFVIPEWTPLQSMLVAFPSGLDHTTSELFRRRSDGRFGRLSDPLNGSSNTAQAKSNPNSLGHTYIVSMLFNAFQCMKSIETMYAVKLTPGQRSPNVSNYMEPCPSHNMECESGSNNLHLALGFWVQSLGVFRIKGAAPAWALSTVPLGSRSLAGPPSVHSDRDLPPESERSTVRVAGPQIRRVEAVAGKQPRWQDGRPWIHFEGFLLPSATCP